MPVQITGSAMYDLATSLNGGTPIDESLFYLMVQTVQDMIEGDREWMILKKTNTSQTASQTTTYQTQVDMPSDFDYWQAEKPVILVDPNNSTDYLDYKEVPANMVYTYQFQSLRFYANYATLKLILLGTISKTYTVVQNYMYKPEAISASTKWVFPGQFHPIISYGVVALHKAGVDFDDQNARMAVSNDKTYQMILENMRAWDDRLQRRSIEGVDRGMNNFDVGPFSGRINMY